MQRDRQMLAEISRQERQANRGTKGGGCLPLLIAALVGIGTVGYALVELIT